MRNCVHNCAQHCTAVCPNVHSCTQLCTVVLSCAQLYTNVHECGTVVHNCPQRCKFAHTAVHSYAQLCTIVHKGAQMFAQLCTIVHNCAQPAARLRSPDLSAPSSPHATLPAPRLRRLPAFARRDAVGVHRAALKDLLADRQQCVSSLFESLDSGALSTFRSEKRNMGGANAHASTRPFPRTLSAMTH